MYQTAVNAQDVAPVPIGVPGVTIRQLWSGGPDGGLTVITEMAPGAVIPRHKHSRADETVFVLEGDFVEDGVTHAVGTYFVGAHNTAHGPHSTVHGCRVLTHFSAPLDFIAD